MSVLSNRNAKYAPGNQPRVPVGACEENPAGLGRRAVYWLLPRGPDPTVGRNAARRRRCGVAPADLCYVDLKNRRMDGGKPEPWMHFPHWTKPDEWFQLYLHGLSSPP